LDVYDKMSQIVQNEYVWKNSDIKLIFPKYKEFNNNSYIFLAKAKEKETKNMIFQSISVVIGLTVGFISAISGIEESTRVFIVSSFSFLSSILGALMALKKYGQDAGKYYAAYKEYKDTAVYLKNLITTFKADQTYEQLNISLTKKESIYEIMLPREELNLDNEETRKKINSAYSSLESVVNDRIKIETERIENALLFIKRKLTIFLFEIKLRLYEKYVVEAFINDGVNHSDILSFDSYIDYLRVKNPQAYSMIQDTYKQYQKQQIAPFYKNGIISVDNLAFDQIEEELKFSQICQLDEDTFADWVNDTFNEHCETIRNKKYDKIEYGQEKFKFDLSKKR